MKRLIVAIGLLMLPLPTLAANPTALSPWVQTIIEKANKGIDVAKQQPVSTTCTAETDPIKKVAIEQNAITDAQTVLRQSVDTQTQIGLQARSLFEQNVCFHSDITLLENKMQDVRQAMVDSISKCNLVGANILSRVYAMLTLAQRELIKGGLDPTYKSNLARTTYYFESKDTVTKGGPTATADINSTAPACPFTSDYAPHSYATTQSLESEGTLSFGCDETVLSTLPESTKAEWEKQHAFIKDMSDIAGKLNTALQNFVNTMNQTIAYIRHGAPADTNNTTALRPSNVRHEKVDGCLYLDDNDLAINTKTLPYVDDFSTVARSPNDAQLPIGLLFRPAYDYFSLFQNPLTLLNRSADIKAAHAYQQALLAQVSSSPTELLSNITSRQQNENDTRTVSANIGREQAIVESWSTDAIERSSDAFATLDTSIKALGNVVKEKGTLPMYIRDVAYFLLRSCVDGHCTKNLDTILKRVLNPYCYPYSSDLYKEDNVPDKCFCKDQEWGSYAEFCSAT